MKLALLSAGLVVFFVGCTVFNTPPDPAPHTETTEPIDAESRSWSAMDAGGVTPSNDACAEPVCP